ncbi:MAG: bifunctional diguanylate cyclase/phosphodiesterase [Gammaproteobacteria bacterium]
MNLQYRILVVVAITMAAVGVVVILVTSRMLGQFAEDRTEQSVAEALTHVQQRFEEKSATLAANVELLTNSETLHRYLGAHDELMRLSLLQQPLLDLFATYQKSYPDYVEIRLLSPDGFEETRLATDLRDNVTEEEADTPYFDKLKSAPRQTVVTVLPDADAGGLAMFGGREVWLPRFDQNPATPEEELRGYLGVTASLQFLQDLTDRLRIGRGGVMVVAQRSGELVFGPAELGIGGGLRMPAPAGQGSSVELGNSHYHVTERALGSDLTAYLLIPADELSAERRRLFSLIGALIGILTLAGAGVIVVVLRRTVVSPIKILQSVAREVRGGRLDVSVPAGPSDEIGDLARAFGEMTLGLREQRAELTSKQRELEGIAYYDHLTGLPNRSLFRARLEQAHGLAQRHGYMMALLFIDLDGFKRINDTLGHDAGDELLIIVAERLSSAVRHTDAISVPIRPAELPYDADSLPSDDQGDGVSSTPSPEDPGEVARLGGDEFTITLSRVESRADASVIAQRVLSALSEPLIVMQQDVVTTPSIGIALFPEDGEDIEELLRHADAAMYAAKRAGKNRFRFYSAEMERYAKERMLMEQRLREALESGSLMLHFQPMMRATDGWPVAVEALLRWNDEVLGPVSPAVFVALAEDVGLIDKLGAWCLEQACWQLAQWQEEFPELVMCVNVSGAQVLESEFQIQLARLLEQTGARAGRLELELTERTVMSESDRTRLRLDEIRSMGVRIAVDDFGTDYSSLAYLKRLPLDVLKVDRRFVTNIDSDRENLAITTAIIALASALDLETVAEGVETAPERDVLTELGAGILQGWYFSKALPGDSCAAWIREQCVRASSGRRSA